MFAKKKSAWLAVLAVVLPCLLGVLAACDSDTLPAPSPTAVAPEPTTSNTPHPTPHTLSGDVFTWRAYAEPETMDPALMQENLSIDIGQNFYDALTELDPDTHEVRGALAESWDVSPDASVYTFHLRKNARFSNGDPVTSADVLYSYNRVANTEDAPYEFIMEDIKGFSDVRASLTSTGSDKPRVTTISGLEAPDPYTVKITLMHPSAYFISESTVWTYYVVNKRQVEKGGEWWIGPGAGTGAYILSGWEHNQSMEMQINPNYWGPAAHVNVQVQIIKDAETAQALFERGQLGALDSPDPNSLDRISKDPNLGKLLHKVGQASTIWMGLNVTKAPFGPLSDPNATRLRQAFAMSIDRQQLINVALGGAAQPATTLLPQGEPGFQSFQAYKFDPQGARKLLADAGHPNCQGLDLTYTYGLRDPQKAVATQLQAEWQADLGCSVKTEGVEWEKMVAARQAHQYTMFYASWDHDYPDPQDWLFTLFDSSQMNGANSTSAAGNDPGYSNPEFDRLVRLGNEMADPSKVDQRIATYQQAEQVLLKDAPIIPLYQPVRYWEVQDKWKGYNTGNSFVYPFRYIR